MPLYTASESRLRELRGFLASIYLPCHVHQKPPSESRGFAILSLIWTVSLILRWKSSLFSRLSIRQASLRLFEFVPCVKQPLPKKEKGIEIEIRVVIKRRRVIWPLRHLRRVILLHEIFISSHPENVCHIVQHCHRILNSYSNYFVKQLWFQIMFKTW